MRIVLAIWLALVSSLAFGQVNRDPPLVLTNPAAAGGAGGAPTDATYYTTSANATLTNEVVPSSNVQTLLGAADFSAARTSLGLAIGTNVQAFDADLSTYAGITPSASAQTLLASTVGTAANANTGTSGATLCLLNAACTFSQQITMTPAGNSNVLTLNHTASSGTTGTVSVADSLTGSGAGQAFNVGATWNTSGNPIAYRANITNTASGTGARFLDFLVSSTSKFSVYLTGAYQHAIVAVGSLPTCNSGAEGMHLGVNDALSPVALATVAAGGAAHVAVYCNGTNWIVG